MKKSNFFLKIIAGFFSLFLSLFIAANVYALVVSGTTVALIMFAGKVYAISGRVINGVTAITSVAVTKMTAEESEKTVRDFIRSIDDNIDKAGHEAYGAPTEEEAKKALEKKANLKLLRKQYQTLLDEVTLNKDLTVGNIAVKEIMDQGVGFILGEFEVPDEAQGKISNWSVEQMVKLGGREVTEEGSKLIELVWKLPQDIWQAGKNILTGQVFGENIDLEDIEISEEDKEFYKALKEGRISPIKVAITKAQWDYFVNVTAKEEFKKYLQGEQSTFAKLPLSIQQKYWRITWLMSDQIDEIHNLMKRARETNNYAEAIKQIIEKYPDYAKLFKTLTKGTTGDLRGLLEKINQGYQDEIEKQKEEVKKAQKDAEKEKPTPTPKPQVQPTQPPQPQESLPKTAEEVVDKAKKLSPYQTKSSCRQFFDNMCRGLCSNEPQHFDMCYQSCMSANQGGCASLPD